MQTYHKHILLRGAVSLELPLYHIASISPRLAVASPVRDALSAASFGYPVGGRRSIKASRRILYHVISQFLDSI